VLLITYELNSSKLIEGLDQEFQFLARHLDRVIFYASIVFITLFIFKWNGLYKHNILLTRIKQFFMILQSVGVTAGIVILFSFIFLPDTLSDSFREFIISFTLIGVVIIFCLRLVFRYVIRKNFNLSTLKTPRNIIIIGAGESAKLYAARMRENYDSINIIFLDDDESKMGTSILGYKVEGKPEDIGFHAVIFNADEICIVIKNISKQRLLNIIHYCKRTNLPIKVQSTHYNLMFTGMYDKATDLMTIPLNWSSRLDVLVKRGIDLVGAITISLILLVPGLLIALMVAATSKGPVFYRSTRVGERGRLFKMIKFRSMKVNVEFKHKEAAIKRLKEGFHMGKVDQDPRITKVGKILRKYNLDELPQLINVIKGEMSLVGPRPCIEYEMQLFEEWHNRRFLVKPGITGLWQITGRQMDNMLLNDAMTTDVFYSDNFSIWMDLRILFKTIPVVFSGTGK
jgi:exopolysaccharide biosynthesis polyprenyl glycosylphosphotransferase